MLQGFLDTSIILRLILDEPQPFKDLSKFGNLFASELLRVEMFRAIDRLRIQKAWEAKEVAARIECFNSFTDKIAFVPMQPTILKRASDPFPTTLRTMDAIHIATALLVQNELNQELFFLTHDVRQGIAAISCGLKVSPHSR